MADGADERARLSDVVKLSREGGVLSDGELRLLLLYRSYEWGPRPATPGDERVAQELGVSIPTVERRRRALLEKGFLDQELRGPKPAAYTVQVPPKDPSPVTGHGGRKAHHQQRDKAPASVMDQEKDPSQDPSQDPSSVPRASKDEVGEWGEEGTSSSVASQPAGPDVENLEFEGSDPAHWTAHLAPIARRFGGERNVADILAWCRDECRSLDAAEQILEGGIELRESGALSGWIEPGQPMGVRVLRSSPRKGRPFVRRAEDAYWSTEETKRDAGGASQPERVHYEVKGGVT